MVTTQDGAGAEGLCGAVPLRFFCHWSLHRMRRLPSTTIVKRCKKTLFRAAEVRVGSMLHQSVRRVYNLFLNAITYGTALILITACVVRQSDNTVTGLYVNTRNDFLKLIPMDRINSCEVTILFASKEKSRKPAITRTRHHTIS